jgi:chaperone modulatory protein CbpM
MNQLTQVHAVILEEHGDFTFDELCHACGAAQAQLMELVEEALITPSGATAGAPPSTTPGEWHFSGVHVQRATVAVRLQRDLGVNAAGAALALQLMDEINALQGKLRAAGQRL